MGHQYRRERFCGDYFFSLYKNNSTRNSCDYDDFLQPGTSQVAAGYVIYGTSTMIVYTTGYGVNGFTLNPAIGTFYLSHPNMKFSEDGISIQLTRVLCALSTRLKITLNANQKKRIDLILPVI
jgi:fructose-1,6-bisphosphatase